jgi:hypothetical protein
VGQYKKARAYANLEQIQKSKIAQTKTRIV